MEKKTINVRVFRFDPAVNDSRRYQDYRVPWTPGTSAMDLLDYIYHNLDSSLAYYDHAGCTLGICARCTGRINNRPGLLCQTVVEGDVTIDPISTEQVIRDLVVRKKG